MQKSWNWDRYRDIKWLNTPKKLEEGGPWELALQNRPPYYEEDERVEEYYSHVVLLITIPEIVERKLTVNASQATPRPQ